ncbi:MAG: type II toxin-antitoxin system YafQ family toxin [Gemmatimonadetes bacterium]|nr:type II toxin-antitoxin system YafQ family toxin [Gemmatimonadota bacterium]MDE2679021.1 type II toxin-antitoxin system YafQ family toxin [Gemmatimonadota bacterium]MXX35555.1 type II toxin-antitoxin system YafQ family toxin [Gemmatimonadota bacterium]MYD15152.1 type II toxin-antitoxin system YafQ family toxin [Gemmatimonadota bacterium]MYI65663.1 type II toxin-antitoxin system YafQ family toxin [Gemmatimonadota bacterium]
MRSLKRPAASRRARLPRRFDYARQFLKDWRRLSRSGRFDMNRLKAVMLQLIANEAPLGPERRDHALKGAWADYRECHVGGDFLLIYRIDDADGPSGSVYFSRAGTHADLFE